MFVWKFDSVRVTGSIVWLDFINGETFQFIINIISESMIMSDSDFHAEILYDYV